MDLFERPNDIWEGKLLRKEERLAKEILDHIGGGGNIRSFNHCMTRVRITLKNNERADLAKLKAVDGVLGVVDDGTLQVIVGPGTVNKVSDYISQFTGMQKGEALDVNEDGNLADLTKANLKKKNNTPFKSLLRKIGSIFIPLIPGLVASGLINGTVGFFRNAGYDMSLSWVQILTLLGGAVFGYLAIVVGWNTAKEFGGTPVLGAIAGILIIHPGLADITLFGENLVPGRGGLIGAMLAAWLMVVFEKQFRKIVPNAVDILLTPLLTILTVGFLTIAFVSPLAGFLSNGITVFIQWLLEFGGPLVGAILAGFFLPLVMVGLHQGLTPIHLELINTINSTPLLPILAMAGAGQVGAAIAIYVKTKNTKLKNVIKGGLPAGFLGIGEPLIYGVTLPLGRPFIASCLGAAVGGAFQAFIGTAASAIGVSGLPLMALIIDNKILLYVLGLVITYISGFLFTYFWGFKEEMADNLN